MNNAIEVSEEYYDFLMKEVEFLECLRRAGVDNWNGYDYACDFYHELYPDE